MPGLPLKPGVLGLFSLFSTAVFAQQLDSVQATVVSDTAQFRQSLESADAPIQRLYNQGVSSMEANRHAEAIEYFSEALVQKPGWIEAFQNRMQCAVALADHTLVIADADSLEELGNLQPITLFQRALALEQTGNVARAISDYEKCVELDPSLSDAAYRRGILAYQANDLPVSERFFNKAIHASPNHIYYYDRAAVFMQTGRFEQAVADYRSAAQLKPNDFATLANLATAHRELGQLKDALMIYDQALQITPLDVIALNNRGYAHYLNGNFDKAQADFDAALQVDSKYCLAHNNRAAVFIKRENWDSAIEAAGQAITCNPDYGQAYLNRGIAREMKRDIPGACSDWSRAAELGIHIAADYKGAICIY